MKFQILNSKGEPMVLNEKEARIAQINQRTVNALGYEIDITTLTTIMKKVSEQKFFEIAPADYIPVRVGEGAWSSQLTTYRSFALADDFSTGIINTGGSDSRLAVADSGVDSLSIQVKNWAKQIGWTIMDLEQAAKAGNWDLVTAKERSRKKNWDLGIQRTAFLGLNPTVLGLFNQVGVTNNTTLIIKPISAMTGAELKTFVSQVLGIYRANNNRTAWPTHFVIPEDDFLGLAGPSSADFPLKSVLQVLEETFQTMTKNPAFKILPCAYADAGAPQAVSATDDYYALYNSDEESLRMDIPVDYTNTLANSVDNFSFNNVGYGQFTGVLAYRPKELMYFSYTV